jgi:hypothetical protein
MKKHIREASGDRMAKFDVCLPGTVNKHWSLKT